MFSQSALSRSARDRAACVIVAVAALATACTHSTSATAARCRRAGSDGGRRRVPIHASVSSRAVGRGPGRVERPPRLRRRRPSERFIGRRPIRTSRSSARTRFRGVTTDIRCGTSATRPIRRSRSAFFCPASQSDVSVYKNLLFVSAEAATARLDCGAQGVPTAVSQERVRGIRIFDITDIANPKYIGNVQTCRGSHTHTVLVDPKDRDNVYVYISGSSAPRHAQELSGCSTLSPSKDPNSPLFRIEVIKVPLAHPEQARRS